MSAPNSSHDQTAIVLAAHGVPPTDYPPMRVGIQMMLEFAGKRAQRIGFLRAWREALVNEARTWPRTAHNDPYKAAVDELAAALASRLGLPVTVAYNEFCAPTIAGAIDQAVADGARRVIVLTTMLVRGNSHTEVEIQEAVDEAVARHPDVSIHYAWPFDQAQLVSLLADQAGRRLEA